MTETLNKYKNFYYPPGGILLWIIILIELFTFGMGLVGLMLFAQEEPEVYHSSRMQLNATYGAINTIFLLGSGYFMAKAVLRYKQQLYQKAVQFIRYAMAGGLLFILLKSLEYFEKLQAGHDLSSNMFYTFYWLLTGFHVVHVLVGLVILAVIARGIRKNKEGAVLDDIEAGAAFWHMCDLIWLLLFPTLYLIL